MELLEPDYQVQPSEGKKGLRVVGPAIALMRENPNRWVRMSTLKNKNSAASRLSGLRSGDMHRRMGIEWAREGCDILGRYLPANDEFSQAAIPEDAPDVDDDSLADPPPLLPPADPDAPQ